MPRGELFLSWLTVNYDPGRGLKYFGSLMIVAGIATMFYMRAYFFAPRARRPRVPSGKRPKARDVPRRLRQPPRTYLMRGFSCFQESP